MITHRRCPKCGSPLKIKGKKRIDRKFWDIYYCGCGYEEKRRGKI